MIRRNWGTVIVHLPSLELNVAGGKDQPTVEQHEKLGTSLIREA